MNRSSSLFGPEEASALTASAQWLTGTALGTIATILAILAVAVVGLMLLTGRMAVREAGRVVIGCFVLFGAPVIAAGVLDLGGEVASPVALQQIVLPARDPRPPLPPANYDPYAGASLRRD